MSRKSKNPNRQGFYNHIEDIKTVERDKDAFLQAARLRRYESHGKPLRLSDILTIICLIGAMVICCVILVLGYMSDNFSTALFGVGIVGVIALLILLCKWGLD